MWDLGHSVGDRASHLRVKFRRAESKKKKQGPIDEVEVWDDGVIGQEVGKGETDEQNDRCHGDR